MLSKKAPFWKKKDRGNLPIEASAMEANASGKVPAQSAAPTPTSQPAQQATPATPAPAPAPQPAASASVPQSVQQSKPATPAPAPKKEQPKTTAESQTIHSNGQATPGFESANAVTKICDMLDAVKTELTNRLASYESELNAQKDSLAKMESESASYHDRLITLEDEMKKVKEQLTQSAPAPVAPATSNSNPVSNNLVPGPFAVSRAVPDGDGIGYFYKDVATGKWEVTWNVNVAEQLSAGQWQKVYVKWQKGSFVSFLDESAICRVADGPRDGLRKTYSFYLQDGRTERMFCQDQAEAYTLSGSYASSELLYEIEYYWWKDGEIERSPTPEELKEHHIG